MLRFLKLANSLAFRHFQGVLRPSSLSQTPILHGKTSRHWTVTILARMSSTGDENATTGYVPTAHNPDIKIYCMVFEIFDFKPEFWFFLYGLHTLS